MLAIPLRLRSRCVLDTQISWLLVQYLPLPARLRPEAVGIFIINIVLGLSCIFFK